MWFSNPQNRLELNASSLGRYSSPLLVTAIDSAETAKQMNAFDDSVKYGQYTIQSIQNGVRVEYHFGQVVKTPLYPQVLTKERFDELLEGLTKAEQNNMKRLLPRGQLRHGDRSAGAEKSERAVREN